MSRWKRTILRLERLEDRLAPSVSSSFSSGALTLTYGATNDSVTVQFTSASAVSITGDGGTTVSGTTSGSVTSITVNGASGDTGQTLVFDLNNQTASVSGAIAITGLQFVTVTDLRPGGGGSLTAASFSDTNSTLVSGSTTTFNKAVTTTSSGENVSGFSTVNVNAAVDGPNPSFVHIAADNINIDTTNGSISGGSSGGLVNLEPFTSSRLITLGTAPGGTLGLTQAELDTITAGSNLLIGKNSGAPSNTGGIEFTAPITSTGTGWTNLLLFTAGSVSQGSGDTITAAGLSIVADDGVTLTETGNQVSTFGAQDTITSGSAFSYTNDGSLTVGHVTDVGFSGITTLGGAVTVTALGSSSTLTVSNPINTTNGGATTTGADITLNADAMAFSAGINGGTGGIVTLAPVTTTDAISFANIEQVVLTTPNAGANSFTLDLTTPTNGVVSVTEADNVTNTKLESDFNNALSAAGVNGSVTVTEPVADTYDISFFGPGVLPLDLTASGTATPTVSTFNAPSTWTSPTSISVDHRRRAPCRWLVPDRGYRHRRHSRRPIGFQHAKPDHRPHGLGRADGIAGRDQPGRLEAGGGIALPNSGNAVSNIVLLGQGDVQFIDGQALTTSASALDPAETNVGVQSDSGTVFLETTAGDLTLAGPVSAGGNSTATLSAAAAIVNDNGANTDVKAKNLALEAGTGIGATGTNGAINTAVGFLVAENLASGGIFINNADPVTIGFSSDSFKGVQNFGSGDIQLTNAGTVNITTFGEQVEGEGGNITITTTTGDINTGGNQFAVFVSTVSSNTLKLDAAGNITLGTLVGGEFGSVSGGGPLTLMAGGNITIDNDSTAESGFSGGAVTVTAGGNVSIEATTAAQGAVLAVENGTDALSITTGAGDTFAIESSTNGVVTGGGAITINADVLFLDGPVYATTSGTVTLAPVTASEVIDLGTAPTTTLGLSNAELGQVTSSQLTIGSSTNTGGIAITNNIDSQTGIPILELLTGGAITDTGGFTLDPTDLALSGTTGIGTSMAPMMTVVSNLVAENTTSGGIFISNTGDLTIGYSGDPFKGIRDTGAATDAIVLTNDGTLDVTDTTTSGSFIGEDIIAPGDVTVTTTGSTSDIVTGTPIPIDQGDGGSIVSKNAVVSVTAGRDLLLGDTTTDVIGNVEAGRSIFLQAGRNIAVDADTFVQAHGSGTLTATAGSTGGNISLLQSTGAVGAEITTKGGAITLTTGASSSTTTGVFTADGGVAPDVASDGGNITINADLVTLDDSPSLDAGTGIVTITTVTAGTVINLGTVVAGDLNLSDANLGEVTAKVLRIGAWSSYRQQHSDFRRHHRARRLQHAVVYYRRCGHADGSAGCDQPGGPGERADHARQLRQRRVRYCHGRQWRYLFHRFERPDGVGNHP